MPHCCFKNALFLEEHRHREGNVLFVGKGRGKVGQGVNGVRVSPSPSQIQKAYGERQEEGCQVIHREPLFS